MEDELYRQELLQRYRNAPNKRFMIKPDIKAEDSNPLCGDHVEIFLRVGNDGKIKEATFEGKGCVISMASVSILLENLIGKTLKEAETLTREDMLDMIGINLTPTRVKCATLGLATLKKGISENKEKKKSSSSTGALLVFTKVNARNASDRATENKHNITIDSVENSNKHQLASALQKKVGNNQNAIFVARTDEKSNTKPSLVATIKKSKARKTKKLPISTKKTKK